MEYKEGDIVSLKVVGQQYIARIVEPCTDYWDYTLAVYDIDNSFRRHEGRHKDKYGTYTVIGALEHEMTHLGNDIEMVRTIYCE